MNQLPANPLSPEEQQKILGKLYLLMGKQVQSYYRHHNMGNNSSVTVELAQDLMESVEYTINLAGGVRGNLDETLAMGQERLKNKLSHAKSMLALVNATAPHWQTECRWDAIQYLGNYLTHYAYLHLAHKGPDDLFYPILISPPEDMRGIDGCIFYLNILWIENQIMAGVLPDLQTQLWERLPADALNPCEYLLMNGMGKAILNGEIASLVFGTEEYLQLMHALKYATQDTVKAAAKRLCQWLGVKDENVAAYVKTVIPQICMWIGELSDTVYLENIFI